MNHHLKHGACATGKTRWMAITFQYAENRIAEYLYLEFAFFFFYLFDSWKVYPQLKITWACVMVATHIFFVGAKRRKGEVWEIQREILWKLNCCMFDMAYDPIESIRVGINNALDFWWNNKQYLKFKLISWRSSLLSMWILYGYCSSHGSLTDAIEWHKGVSRFQFQLNRLATTRVNWW